MSERQPPERSSTIGPYRLVRRLGAGGMGVVYLGHDLRDGTAAAVKLIRPERAADTASRERLRREVAAARRVPRFCTAPVLEADLHGDPLWVATEFVDGPDLDTALLHEGRLSGGALEGLAVGLAVALRAIHQQGVIHRDLKPSNVLLSSLGPRVIDFGIAQLEDEPQLTRLTEIGGVVGTPAFMAPEQLSGRPLTTAVDVFAWAGLVSCAATGRRPFGVGAAALPAILHGQPDLGELAEPLRGLVTAAFAKDPAARPSAAALVDQLTGIAPVTASRIIATAAASPPVPPAVPAPAGLAAPPVPPSVPVPPAPTVLATPPALPVLAALPGSRALPVPPSRRRRAWLAAGSVAAVAAVAAVLATVAVTAGWLLRDGAAGSGRWAAPAFEGTLTIGGLLPTSGGFAPYAAGISAGAQLAVADINAAGGVWGNEVGWIVEDEAGPRGPAAAAEALISQGADAVVGAVGSAASLEVLPMMHESKIIMVSPTNTAIAFTSHEHGEYYFRVSASDAVSAAVLAQLVLADGHTTLAILAERSEHDGGVVEAVEQAYTAGGGQVLHREIYDESRSIDRIDFAALVSADAAAFLLMLGPITDSLLFWRFNDLGYTPRDAQWYFLGSGAYSYGSSVPEGMLAGAIALQRVPVEEPAEFRLRVDELAGSSSTVTQAAEAYDAVTAVALAAVAAGTDDPDAVRDEMVEVTTGGVPCASFAQCRQLLLDGADIDYSGHSGLSWNEHGDPVETRVGVYRYLESNNLEQIDVVVGRS